MKQLAYIISLLAFLNPCFVLAEQAAFTRSEVSVTLPNVQQIRQDGKKVRFVDEMNDGRALVVSFIYTSCSAICPMTSQTLYHTQNKLADAIDKVHLVSISLDPEHDTPKQLAAYAEKFHAGKSWQHYTGTEEASIAIQKAMGAYRGDKMNHVPLFFVKPSKSDKWIRLDGFVTADDLLRELHGL